jgi:hypothetical protein
MGVWIMWGEIRISASLISASETIHEKGIREVMRVTSKKQFRSPQNQTVAVKPVI